MAQETPAGNVARGQAYFQIACTVCHSPTLGSNNTVIETGLQNLTKPLWRFICRPAQDHPAGALP